MTREKPADPRTVIYGMQSRLQSVMQDLRDDISNVDDLQLKAMFETAADVLGGSNKAFYDYQKKNEAAWR